MTNDVFSNPEVGQWIFVGQEHITPGQLYVPDSNKWSFLANERKIMSDLCKWGLVYPRRVLLRFLPNFTTEGGSSIYRLFSFCSYFQQELFGSLWELILFFGPRISGITHPSQSNDLRNKSSFD